MCQRALSHSPTHPLTHPLTHSLAHSLTRSHLLLSTHSTDTRHTRSLFSLEPLSLSLSHSTRTHTHSLSLSLFLCLSVLSSLSSSPHSLTLSLSLLGSLLSSPARLFSRGARTLSARRRSLELSLSIFLSRRSLARSRQAGGRARPRTQQLTLDTLSTRCCLSQFSVCLSVCLSVCQSVCQSVSLSVSVCCLAEVSERVRA